MELDELRAAWQSMDTRLASQQALTREILRYGRRHQLLTVLRPMVVGQTVGVVSGLAGALGAAAFWVQRSNVPHLLAIGIMMQVYAILLILVVARTLALIAGVDANEPVVALQRRVALIRRTVVLGGIWLGLPWWILWVPVLVMVFHAFLGVDLMVREPGVVVGCALFGAAGLLVTLERMRRMRATPDTVQRLDSIFAGRGLVSVQRTLDDLARFERE